MDERQVERRPRSPGWTRVEDVPLHPRPLAASRWMRGRVLVLSALEDVEYPDGRGRGPQWHISISRSGRRPSESDVRCALRSFRMVGTEEDNHHPGVARHFWLPVDRARRVDCECKVEDEVIREPDGYTWSNPRGMGEACQGCAYGALHGKPCPLHNVDGASDYGHEYGPQHTVAEYEGR